jgi:hypothetical protein
VTRNDALDCIAREGVFMVSPEHAEEVAKAFGVTLDKIGIVPTPADQLALAPLGQFDKSAVRIKAGRNGSPTFGIPGAKAVWMYQLAATLALHFGLYKSIDHAMQTPWHKPQSEARYIGGRAAVRLAMYFEGREATITLRERNPFLPDQLFHEDLFTGTGQVAKRTPTYKMGDA